MHGKFHFEKAAVILTVAFLLVFLQPNSAYAQGPDRPSRVASRDGKWLAPVASTILSSNEADHIARGSVNAWDLSMKEGSNIYPMAAGTVTYAGCDNIGNYGCHVEIDYGGGISSRYAHFIDEANPALRGTVADPNGRVLVKTGQKVDQWTILGHVGWTGLTSFGPHTHWEIMQNGQRMLLSTWFDAAKFRYCKMCAGSESDNGSTGQAQAEEPVTAQGDKNILQQAGDGIAGAGNAVQNTVSGVQQKIDEAQQAVDNFRNLLGLAMTVGPMALILLLLAVVLIPLVPILMMRWEINRLKRQMIASGMKVAPETTEQFIVLWWIEGFGLKFLADALGGHPLLSVLSGYVLNFALLLTAAWIWGIFRRGIGMRRIVDRWIGDAILLFIVMLLASRVAGASYAYFSNVKPPPNFDSGGQNTSSVNYNGPQPKGTRLVVWIALTQACQLEGNGCDPGLLYGIKETETPGVDDCLPYKNTSGSNKCRSYAGAEGPFQFMPGTWPSYAEAGWDKWNMVDSARACWRMLKALRLPDQKDQQSFASRFTGYDGGQVWNQGSPGSPAWNQALSVWKTWQDIKASIVSTPAQQTQQQQVQPTRVSGQSQKVQPTQVPNQTLASSGGKATQADVDNIKIIVKGNPPKDWIPTTQQVTAIANTLASVGLTKSQVPNLTICVSDESAATRSGSIADTMPYTDYPETVVQRLGSCRVGIWTEMLRNQPGVWSSARLYEVLAHEVASHIVCPLKPGTAGCAAANGKTMTDHRIGSPYFMQFCTALGGSQASCQDWNTK